MLPDRHASAAERMPHILRRLKKAYPDARIALNFSTGLQCLIAVILSAQTTDEQVNRVTKVLFEKYRSPQDYLEASEEDLQADIRATGFFRQKTRSLRGMCRMLLERHGGEVPRTMKELIALPGVARKTANIVLGNVYPDAAKKDPDYGIAVDTHVGRIAVRLGLTSWRSKEAEKIEQDLMKLVPKRDWYRLSYLFIEHGRSTCVARSPQCERCPVEPLCPSSQEAGLPDLYRASPSAPATR
ncbi:MAG: endonuclease III [Actinomycetota bacterium]|nr:endonuclease III [Actinomycetota bacterium]